MAHPFGAGVEGDNQADDANGPERTEGIVHELQDLFAGSGISAAKALRDSVGNVVEEPGLYDGEHESGDRKSHHHDRDNR